MHVITTEIDELWPEVERIAQEFQLTPIKHTNLDDSVVYKLFLTYQGLQLVATSFPNSLPVSVDFLQGDAEYRRKHGGGFKQALAKAVGVTGKHKPTVVDVTAGLGGDAFVLSCLGAQVQMLERSPMIAALLFDGLRRLKAQEPEFPLTLHFIDANDYVARLSSRPEVIYFDPMFPERKKSALVKKEMRILQTLIGEDLDSSTIFDKLLTTASKRVVVKRPRTAPLINELEPSFIIAGKACRFDIYLSI